MSHCEQRHPLIATCFNLKLIRNTESCSFNNKHVCTLRAGWWPARRRTNLFSFVDAFCVCVISCKPWWLESIEECGASINLVISGHNGCASTRNTMLYCFAVGGS